MADQQQEEEEEEAQEIELTERGSHRGPADVAITIENPDDPHCSPPSRTFYSERDVDFDRDVLHRGVRDAGRWAYGTIIVEVWVWNERGTHLIRPPGGWWLDPIFHSQQHEALSKSGLLSSSQVHSAGLSTHAKCPLCQLTDPQLDTYEPPKPLTIGEGIPGVLWAELQDQGKIKANWTPPVLNAIEGGESRRHLLRRYKSPKQLVWRSIHDIAQDPDQPYNPRVQLLAQRLVTKIGLAAAVPFDIQGSQGLVVYYARAGVSMDRLQNADNETYLVSAAQLIGSAYALRKPRQAVVSRRHEELQETMARVKRKIRRMGRGALIAKQMQQGQLSPTESQATTEEATTTSTTTSKASCRDYPWIQFVESNLLRFWYKLAGGGAQPPPAFGWTQTAWTFVGVFATLLAITRINLSIDNKAGSEYTIVLGPFGALMTLVFGLTGAPASQPRNAMLGQTISMSIAIGISHLDDLPAWVQQSLATALAVTCMVKFGITHPPAGAAALLFATGKHGWYNMLAVLMGNAVAIVAATIINDINPERQYPTYWGILHYVRVVLRRQWVALMKKKEDPEKESSKQA